MGISAIGSRAGFRYRSRALDGGRDGGSPDTFLVSKFHLPAHIEACNLKFSFNLTRDVGQTDGEAPERGWADANPLARSTKEMGSGFRRDTLDDHFNDWNHKKIIALGYTMRRKVEKAMPEMVTTREALADMEELLGSKTVKEWREMARLWEADDREPDPFETIRKDQHVAKVRAELAAEAAEREAAGTEDAGSVKGDMHITELIGMGLQLEDQQRILAFDIAASTGLHPTDGQRRAMTERTSKLRRKISAWIDVQTKFFPGLKNIREGEDEVRARLAEGASVPGVKVSEIALWLPSALADAPTPEGDTVVVKKAVQEHEYRLRVRQASEALHEVRRLLLVRTHLYKLKDTHSRGVRQNMRSGDKIAALNAQVKRTAAQYRVARTALAVLGDVLKRKEWEWTLLDLKEDDIRGLPQSHFRDPDRKKKKNKQPPRPLSWIWVTRAKGGAVGDDVAMNEAVRIEWAKTRAHAMRLGEEVDLLEEEMARIIQFLRWRSGWWMERADGLEPPDRPQREGSTSYALRQASTQAQLADEFVTEWQALPELIRRGRGGELVEAEDSDDEEEVFDDSEEEDEPIPTLPLRPVKPTYVDEVLVM
ncbi:hypothetical protein B0H19DRAFT_1383490 [Mycena capillaripes]|nr:hypothetical protein B0H19DRAFT_1383490 [Mycena capillaripes]